MDEKNTDKEEAQESIIIWQVVVIAFLVGCIVTMLCFLIFHSCN